MEQKFEDLNIQEKKDINILLLGETGVGKSTFINSIANYLHHKDLKKAKEETLFHLIPCMFNITDEQNKMHSIVVGEDSNEFQKVGSSATQDVKTYVFPIGNGNTRLRLIDSPGMGDPRGIDQDDINCENILTYISQLHELHAICFLFKPNDSRITVTFEYCVKQILSRLDKSAANNIIFIFTNTKGTHYKPGETIACLKQVVEDIRKDDPNINIKVDQNVFCFDNEAFRYLAAFKKGVIFSRKTEEEYLKSWKTSSLEGEKLIKHIVGDEKHKPLKPHHVKSSISINEARRVINQLGQPLTDISQLILDNLRILDRREKELKHQNFSLVDLRSKLYVPIINLRVIRLTQPATVCCDAKCAECVLVDGTKVMNYKQRCHDPCHLKNVPQEIVGAPELRYCASMNRVTQTCLKCNCAQTVHMHIYYMTEKFDDKKKDNSIQSRINTSEKALAEAVLVINEIKKRKSELEQEKDAIINCAAKFAAFLQKNAITPFNDAYRKYLNYMIFRESNLREKADQELLHHLKILLLKYDNIKETFDKVVELSLDNVLDPKDISAELSKLYALKHNGKKIKELYTSQKFSRKKEYEKTEYVHSSPVLNVGNKTQQSQTSSDIEGNARKREYQKKQNRPLTQFKPYKSQNYFNKDTIRNGVKTMVSSATGSNEQIKIEITKTNSNPNYRQNHTEHFRRTRNQSQGYGPYNHNSSYKLVSGRRPHHEVQAQQNRPSERYDDPTNPQYNNHQPFSSENYNRQRLENRNTYDYSSTYGTPLGYNYRRPYDNLPLSDHRSYSDGRPSYDDRPPYGRPYDDRPPNGRPYDDRPPNGRLPYERRPPPDYSPHERRPYDGLPPYDDRRPYDDRPAYDNKPPCQRLPSYDNRPAYDTRYSDRAYNDTGDRSAYLENRPHRENRPPYDQGNSYNQQRYDYTVRPGERVGDNYHHVPPPPYHDYNSRESRQSGKQVDEQPRRSRGRSRPKYRSSGEKGSSRESD